MRIGWLADKGGDMAKRTIVRIDESKCTGCGQCVTGCHEGALQMVEGKARIVSETYCDGLGACIGDCPEGAITIEEREAPDFDPVAVEEHFRKNHHHAEHSPAPAHVCPGSAVRVIREKTAAEPSDSGGESEPGALTHWPVQLTLVPAHAPYLKGADVLLVADCVPFAMGDFHRRLLRGHLVLIACPKLDDSESHVEKLALVVKESGLKSLTAVHMEVPCCFGLTRLAEHAIEISGVDIPLKEVNVGIDGRVKE
jgi:ferredoxin